MIRNADGTLMRSTAVAATTNRTSQMLAARKSTIGLPATRTTSSSPTVSRNRTGMTVKTIFPASVSRPHDRATAVIQPALDRPWRGSLVDAAHDRVEGRHHRHRVGDQVARHQHAHRLEVDERRVVDPEPERLVRAVTDRVDPVLPAGRLDRGVRPTRPRPEETRQLGQDGPVGHVVETLVDDPEALLDLVHPDQVAGEAVALLAGRDVELELRKDAVRVGATHVEGDAGRAQVRPRHAHPERRLAIDRAEAAHPANEDL